MAFTRIPQVHMIVDGSCVDITADVRQADPITVTRGGMDEQRRPVPSKCTFLLNNRHRTYSPHNPTSAYYKLLGINTPILLRLLVARDEFAGTTSNGWGSAEACGIRDTAYAWTNNGGANSDYAEAAGAATHLISAAADVRYSTLTDVSYRDVGVLLEASCSVTDVTGGVLELGSILLRGGATYYIVRIFITTAEALTIEIVDFTGATVAAPVAVTGVVDAVSAKTISVRAEAEGEMLRARVWKTGDPEPGIWHIAVEDRTYLSAGWVGVRSGTGAGNTNTPVTFSYSRVEVYAPIFAGEVAKWPTARDRSGNERVIRIEAWDLFQRLRQGKAPLKSALRRGITGQTLPAVAYWPCEDGKDATVIASDSPAAPMWISGGADLASNDDFPCSEDLPVLSGAALFGTVPTYTPTSGQTQIRLLLSVPAGGDTNGEKIIRVSMVGGTTGFWDVVYGTGGTLTLNVFDPLGALITTTGAVAFSLNGRPLRLSLELDQNGADIAWNLSVLDLTGTAGGTSGTLAGRTYGRVDWINVGGDALFTGTAVGHITVEAVVNDVLTLLSELLAYTGERAEDRIAKLATAEGITAYVGEGTVDGQEMGPQRPLTLQDLLEECAAADLGGLATAKGEHAVVYTRLNYFYNQTPAVTLSLSGWQLDNFEPEYDNFLLRNKITAKRVDGSSYTATQMTGRLAAVDVMDGGVGVYDDEAEVNVRYDTQLRDVAGYQVLLGTVDQPRFPDLAVNLGNYEVRASESLTRALVDVGLWQRWQVTGASAADLYDTVDLLVVGYTLVLSTFVHRLTANCYPYDPNRVFELDSATYGRLDMAGSTLNEALDTTETGVDVALADTTLWGTDTPYDIDIGGERMTVTAVAGSSSPQTLTVTRSVNGVVKTHAVGAEVHLAPATYLAGW